MTPASKIAEIRKRLEAATPGPWEPCLGSGMHECTAIHFAGNEKYPNGLIVCDLIPDYMMDGKYKEDIEFKPANIELIANAPTDIAFLLEQLERCKEALEAIANHKQTSIDKIYLLHQCEAYQKVASKALEGDGE